MKELYTVKEQEKGQPILNNNLCLLFSLLFVLLFILGCTSAQTQPQSLPLPKPLANSTPIVQTVPTICNNKNCFISVANSCTAMNLTITEDIGVLQYSSSNDCVFTKTLVSLNVNETKEMKNLLEGTNMTCRYPQGKFDSRLVTTLIQGMENCKGKLKDNLGNLIVFS